MDENLPWFLLTDDPERIYTKGSYVVLDFETSGDDFGTAIRDENDIVLACWQVVDADGTVITKHKFGGIYEQKELLDDISSVDFVVAQNCKYELQWLKRCGLDLHDVLPYDTLLAAWVLDGNRKRPRDLDSLAMRYGIKGKEDIVASLIHVGVKVTDINQAWLLEYCHRDVEVARQVFLRQSKQLSLAKQWHLVHTRNLCCSVLSDIEFEGLNLDKTRVEEEYKKTAKIVDELGKELAVMTGGINLGSPKQLGHFLYKVIGFSEPVDYRGEIIKTSTGNTAASATALATLIATTDEQKKFLELYKEYNKAVSLLEKNLDYFKLTCEQKDGKFFGQIRQAVVQTGRLASSGIPVVFAGLKRAKSVQLQNIPREYKKLFWSGDEDWYIFEADSGQLEFRVAVEMAGPDPVGYKEIAEGTDIHSYTAKVLYDNGDPEMLSLPAKERRQAAKKSTFRPLYGGSSGSDALVAYCDYFKKHYAGVSKMQHTWAEKCAARGWYDTPYGMRFYFPDTKVTRSGYITNSTSIYNFPVQGFATGEIIPIALVYFWHRSRGKNIKMFCTIHDSIVSRVHKDSIKEAQDIASKALTSDVYKHLERVYNFKFHTPLGLGMKTSRNWGDTKDELKYDVFPDGTMIDRS